MAVVQHLVLDVRVDGRAGAGAQVHAEHPQHMDLRFHCLARHAADARHELLGACDGDSAHLRLRTHVDRVLVPLLHPELELRPLHLPQRHGDQRVQHVLQRYLFEDYFLRKAICDLEDQFVFAVDCQPTMCICNIIKVRGYSDC